MAKKKLTIEEKLQAALVPAEEQPYKVPENWCWVRLNNINEHKSTTVDPQNYPNDDFELYSVPSSADDYPEMITGEEIGSTKQVVQKDDVLLCKINPRINRVWKVSQYTDNSLLASSEWIIVRNKNVLSDYLMWCFRTPYFRKYMLSNVSGVGGSLMRAQPKYVKTYPIPLPPYIEQSRIVARIESLFAKLDEAKEKIQEVLDGADLRRAAILHQAFTGKLTEKWRRENGVSDESWEYKSIKEIAVPRAGVAFDSKKFSTKGYQVIRMGNLYNGELDLSRNPVYYPREFLDNKILERALIHNDDILITLTGTKYKRDYGYAVKMVNPEKLLVNQRILCLTAIKEYVLSDYLNYYLQTKLFRDVFFSNETGGVNQGNVSSKFVESIVIKVPLVDEQQEIVHLLDNLLSREQSTVTACEEALTTIDTLKKSILARAFRGELGTNDPADPSAKELLREILSA